MQLQPRQPHSECRSLSFDARHLDAAPLGVENRSRNREPEPRVATRARPALVRAIEALEDVWQIRGPDADSRVGDLENRVTALSAGANPDLPARPVVRDRVRDEICDDDVDAIVTAEC